MIKKFLAFIILLCVHNFAVGQDEGAITKKARVLSKSTTLYVALGPSFSIGSGDYSGGFNVQAGLLKRLNRIVSIGPFLSLAKFNSNQSKKGTTNFIEEVGYEIQRAHMKGGDLQLISLGMDMKFNFVPSERVTKFSPYAIAKPFVLISKRSDLTANADTWYRDDILDNEGKTWYYTGTSASLSPDRWDANTEFTAGLNVGVGAEWIMTSGLSFFLQSTAGFTLPITYVDTGSYSPTLSGFNDPEFPLAKKSFSSLTVSLGVAYTF